MEANVQTISGVLGDVEIIILGGEVLFNANHVAQILEIRNLRDAVAGWDERYRKVLKNSDVGFTDIRKFNNKGETFLTEAGLYKLIFKSRKPIAEKFQDWVVLEVLPSIRKYGFYVSPFLKKHFEFDDPNIPLHVKQAIADLLNQNKELLLKTKELQLIVHTLKHHGGSFTSTQLAQELHLKDAYHLNTILKELGIIEHDNGTWILSPKFRETDWVILKQGIKDEDSIYYTRWSFEGRAFVLSLFKYIDYLDTTYRTFTKDQAKIYIQKFIDEYLDNYLRQYRVIVPRRLVTLLAA